MKIFVINLLLILLFLNPIHAQKVSLQKWASHIVDSLQNVRVDTIEYYHSYCGECQVSKPKEHSCDFGNAWEQIASVIVYQQNGGYYSLTFKCGYPPTKKQLKSAKSLIYFLSIVPILNSRDKAYKTLRKQHGVFFSPPIVTDGTYEEADIYCHNTRQHIFMQEDQKTDKAWRSFFWIDKQTQLLALLEHETSVEN